MLTLRELHQRGRESIKCCQSDSTFLPDTGFMKSFQANPLRDCLRMPATASACSDLDFDGASMTLKTKRERTRVLAEIVGLKSCLGPADCTSMLRARTSLIWLR